MHTLCNFVCGLWPKHKRMLYCACVLPIATYGCRLWLYKGPAMKGPLNSLRKMQRRACLWVTGALKTSPIGAAETLVGVPPIHLHVKKLVEQSHVCTYMLQASHVCCRLVNRDKGHICGDLKSPVTEAWLNQDFSSLDLDPVNRFNQPGLHPKDLYHGHIVYDIATGFGLSSLSTMYGLLIQDNTCPYPFAKCWCLGSNTIDHQLAHILATLTCIEAVTSTAVPNNTELPFGLVSSSHQPCHSTHTHRLKVDTRGFSRIHLIRSTTRSRSCHLLLILRLT
jgi:hypothetical protein